MFARFDENPTMTLQDIKETKRYRRTDAHTDAHTRTHRQRENSIPTTNKVCGGYNQDIKETKRYGRTHTGTHTHTCACTDNVKTIYPPQTKFAGGIIICLIQHFEAEFLWKVGLEILNSEIILETFTHVYCNIFKTRRYLMQQ